jgi:hypothetical protein
MLRRADTVLNTDELHCLGLCSKAATSASTASSMAGSWAKQGVDWLCRLVEDVGLNDDKTM